MPEPGGLRTTVPAFPYRYEMVARSDEQCPLRSPAWPEASVVSERSDQTTRKRVLLTIVPPVVRNESF